MVGNVHVNTSPFNGANKTTDFIGDRWVFRLRYGPQSHAQLPKLRAFWNRFKGAAHVCQIWNMANPVPLGTMRGSPTLAAGKVAGTAEFSIVRTDAGTLLPGDWVGITLSNGAVQTVEVVESIVTNGLQITVNPPLRRDTVGGAPVYWFHPLVSCLLSESPVISHGLGSANNVGYSDGFSVDLVEFIE